MRTFCFILTILVLAGCSSKDEVDADTNVIDYAKDFHPDPEITIKISPAQYSETVKIAADWNGKEYYNYTFEDTKTHLDRLLLFLFWDFELDTPEIVGVELLPNTLFSIDFGNKSWGSKQDAKTAVLSAIEVAFDVKISLDNSTRTILIENRDNKIEPNQSAHTTPASAPR